MIQKQGELVEHQSWGQMKLAYEIQHQDVVDYQVFQFSGEPPLLDALNHSLKIADGIMRFRIVKTPAGAVKSGIPSPPQRALVATNTAT